MARLVLVSEHGTVNVQSQQSLQLDAQLDRNDVQGIVNTDAAQTEYDSHPEQSTLVWVRQVAAVLLLPSTVDVDYYLARIFTYLDADVDVRRVAVPWVLGSCNGEFRNRCNTLFIMLNLVWGFIVVWLLCQGRMRSGRGRSAWHHLMA